MRTWRTHSPRKPGGQEPQAPLNGRPCYHLKGINTWGKVNEHFYDTETGLLLGYAFNTAWRGLRAEC